MRDKIITIILLLMIALNMLDIYTDISIGVSNVHIIFEASIIIAASVGAIFLIRDISARTADISKLKKALQVSDDNLKHISAEMKNARREYSSVIQNQFKQWSLTPSEQEVAMLLLKGLSFKEISSVRNTKEKTVRQQGSIIYSKANVEGRHEFAAWFLADFM